MHVHSVINLMVSYTIVCVCCHMKCHWSVRPSPLPLLIGADNVNSYPFRISAYTELQIKVMWSGQRSVSLMVPMLTTKLRSVMMYMYTTLKDQLLMKCTLHVLNYIVIMYDNPF